MTLILVWCHVSPKISVFMLLVCSKMDWHNTLSLDILMFIATQYSPCWGVLDYLATLGTVNVQVIQVWRHVSKITTQGWCICEIDSRRQVSLQEVSPDYDQWALEQSAIYFVIVTSGHDVHQSVQFCCPGSVHLDWNNIPQQFLAHWLGQCVAVAKPASMQMVDTHAADFVDVQKTLVLFKTSTKWR
jgi:hypothetical protein